MAISTATNSTTGNAGSPGRAAVTVVTVPNKGDTTSEIALLSFNDGEGINELIPVTTTGKGSGSTSSPDGEVIKAALSQNPAINGKYTIANFNQDEITITQKNNTGDVTISVTLTSANFTVYNGKRTVGVAEVLGTKDKDKFTVTNVAATNGYIVVRISDDTGLGNIDVTISGITSLDTMADIATKIANALILNPAISTKYAVTASGEDIELETRSTFANSITVSLQ